MATAHFRYDIVGKCLGQQFVVTNAYRVDSTYTEFEMARTLLEQNGGSAAALQTFLSPDSVIEFHRVYRLHRDPLRRFTVTAPYAVTGTGISQSIAPFVCARLERRGRALLPTSTAPGMRAIRSRWFLPGLDLESLGDGVVNMASNQMSVGLPAIIQQWLATRQVEFFLPSGVVLHPWGATPSLVGKSKFDVTGEPLDQPLFLLDPAIPTIAVLRSRQVGHGR